MVKIAKVINVIYTVISTKLRYRKELKNSSTINKIQYRHPWKPLRSTKFPICSNQSLAVLYRCVYSKNTWSGCRLFEHISMACNVSTGDHFTLQSQWCDSAQKGNHTRPLAIVLASNTFGCLLDALFAKWTPCFICNTHAQVL